MVVHGRVQGVGFRYTVEREAAARGVAGWASNRDDGTLEAVLEGEDDAVDRLLALCGRGPHGAAVDRLETAEEEPEGLRGFETR